MFGKNHRVSPLASRKLLLIAESELNRAQMAGDVAAVAQGVRALTDRVQSIGSIASSAAGLVSGLAGLRRDPPAATETKPSWMRTALRGAGVVSNLWLAFKAARRDRENSRPDGLDQ